MLVELMADSRAEVKASSKVVMWVVQMAY
jgi:hypothetical protein